MTTMSLRLIREPPMAKLVSGWPLGWYWMLAPNLVIFLCTVGSNLPGRGKGIYSEWVVASSSVHESLILGGPIICLWSGATGFMLASRSTIFYGSAALSRGQQFLCHVSILSISSFSAIFVGLLPELIHAMRSATWGRLSLCDVAISLAGIVMLVAISFVLGASLRKPRWLIAFPIVAFIYLILPRISDRAFSVVDPVQSWQATPRFSQNPSTTMYFVLFAIICTFAAYGVFREHEPLLAPRLLICNSFAIALLVFIPFLWRPDLYILRTDPAPSCQKVSQTLVCVHPAHVKSLPTITSAVLAISRAGGSTLIQRFTDQDAADYLKTESGLVILPIGPQTTQEDIYLAMVEVGVGNEDCSIRYPTQGGSGVLSSNLALALSSRLLNSVGDQAGASNFSNSILDRKVLTKVQKLPESSFRHALTSTKIKSCDLTLKDL